MRAPSPALVAAVRDVVLAHDAADPVTGERLVALVREMGVACGCVRRVQEAISLLVDQGEPIAATSIRPAGYYRGTAQELRRAAREIDSRVCGMFLRRRALRRAAEALEGRASPQLHLPVVGVRA